MAFSLAESIEYLVSLAVRHIGFNRSQEHQYAHMRNGQVHDISATLGLLGGRKIFQKGHLVAGDWP